MSYFEERIYGELGATPEQLKIQLRGYDLEHDRTYTVNTQCFQECSRGIAIPLYDINRNLLYHDRGETRGKEYKNCDEQTAIIRLATPKEYKEEKTGEVKTVKYLYPKGAESRPYFPSLILEDYEKHRKIDTLVLTEGYFKAFKACMHGIHCIGLQSISTYREKGTGAMFYDIIQYVQRCNVRNVVMLYDGDCTDISRKALQQGKDLYTRPAGFISSCENIRELFKDYGVDFYFACVNTKDIEGNPKGLDDLLCRMRGKEGEVAKELETYSRAVKYFVRFNVSRKMTKVYDYFCTNNIESFYDLHQEAIGTTEFIFKGTKYLFDQERQEVAAVLRRDLSNFCRVGDDYYETVLVPNQYGTVDAQLRSRKKGTITDDFGKNSIAKIPKYKAFCNVPNHTSYQAVVHDCLNLYSPFTHKVIDGECPASIELVKHIFGTDLNADGIPYWQMGLDYIQLLYQKPTEMLPVLCLVSHENKTGKSTFAKWLREIFGLNAIFVGSQDFADNFNFHWAGKLLIMCEETELDRSQVMDKVKSLSTNDKVTMNRKGKDQEQVAFFGKFVLCSNNEERFIKAGKDDERYFVLKVPTIQNLDPFFQQRLTSEIPHFLHFLNNREMAYKQKMDRMWFPAKSYRTAAFEKVVMANQSKAEREIRYFIHQCVEDFNHYSMIDDMPSVVFGMEYLHMTMFNGRLERTYLRDIVANMPHEQIKKTKRYKIPRWDQSNEAVMFATDGVRILYDDYTGKPWAFHVKDYLTPEEYKDFLVRNRLEE